MKKRPPRTFVNVEAELISNSVGYKGYIMNLSDDGLYVITTPTKSSIDFIPGNALQVKFQDHSGKTLNLHCEVEWLHIHKTPPSGLTNSMGIEILDTPQEYRDFFVFRTIKSD
jgi:hypothetical protein